MVLDNFIFFLRVWMGNRYYMINLQITLTVITVGDGKYDIQFFMLRKSIEHFKLYF